MRSRIDPVYLALGVLFAIATGVAMASEVSILFVWAGIVLTTLSLVAALTAPSSAAGAEPRLLPSTA